MVRFVSLLSLVLAGAAAGGAATAQSQSASSANDPNRLICRRMPETGSLVSTTRQCFTRAEWDRIAESQRSGAERTIDGLRNRQSGN